MLTHHEEAAADEPWPRRDVDPELDERMRAAGVRIPTRSLDRPRVVVKPRPAWLAFLLRAVAAIDASGRRLFRLPPRDALEIDDLEEGAGAEKPAEVDPEMDTWLRSMRIRPATHSLDRPRHVVKQRPAWLAYLVNRLKAWG